MRYIDYVGFHNIQDARFLLQKAIKDEYPQDFIEELENKIHEYENYITLEMDRVI